MLEKSLEMAELSYIMNLFLCFSFVFFLFVFNSQETTSISTVSEDGNNTLVPEFEGVRGAVKEATGHAPWEALFWIEDWWILS